MIVCGDDFGLSEDVNHAILDLAGQRRLSAVSCLVTLPDCDAASVRMLRAFRGGIDLGLHLLLAPPGMSEREPAVALDTDARFRSLLRASLLGRLEREAVAKSLAGQYGQFVERFGFPPDFIDGHRHVHQLPVVRDIVVAFTTRLPSADRPYIRNSFMPLAKIVRQGVAFWKCWSIAGFGRTLRTRLWAAGLATNDGFGGIYDYRSWRKYPRFLSRFAHCMESGNGILMTHPGRVEGWRQNEYESLKAFEFPGGPPVRFRRS